MNTARRYRISLISITRKNIITFVAKLDNSHFGVNVLDWIEQNVSARADKCTQFDRYVYMHCIYVYSENENY